MNADFLRIQGDCPISEDQVEINLDRRIFILADGFGGGPGKKVAEISTQAIKQFLEQEAGDLDATLPFELRSYYSLAGNVLFNAVSFANHEVSKVNEGKNWMNSGGASVTAAYQDGKLLAIAQVGTNAVFLKRASQSTELTVSRSLARQMDPFHPYAPESHVPMMSLGTSKSLEPEIFEVEVQPGDQIVICTSGFRSLVAKRLAEDTGSFQDLVNTISEANLSLIWIRT